MCTAMGGMELQIYDRETVETEFREESERRIMVLARCVKYKGHKKLKTNGMDVTLWK